jgi:hypothetical protein
VNFFDPWISQGPMQCSDCGRMCSLFSVIGGKVYCTECLSRLKTEEFIAHKKA